MFNKILNATIKVGLQVPLINYCQVHPKRIQGFSFSNKEPSCLSSTKFPLPVTMLLLQLSGMPLSRELHSIIKTQAAETSNYFRYTYFNIFVHRTGTLNSQEGLFVELTVTTNQIKPTCSGQSAYVGKSGFQSDM